MTSREAVRLRVEPAYRHLRDELRLNPVGVGIGGNDENGFRLAVILSGRPEAELPRELLGVPVEYQFVAGQVEAMGGALPAWRRAGMVRQQR